VLLWSAPVLAQNLVQNGGFDSSVTGWNAGGCTVTWNPSDAGGAASSGSAKVVSPSTFMPPDFCLAQTITAPENAAYAFTAKGLSGGSGPAGVGFQIRAIAADGHELNFRRYSLPWSPNWQAFSAVFVTPLGTTKVQIGVNVPDTYFIDDVGLRPTSAPTPVVTAFRASKARLCKGQSASLSWITDYASSVTIDHGIGTQPVNITSSSTGPSIAPIQTTTYTMTASGPGGSTMATATLPVDDGPPGITFTATPSTIGAGQPSTLAWTVTNAVFVSLQAGNDDGSEVAANGTQQVAPAQSTIYTITALGACATVSKQVTVTVSPLPTATFTATPRSAGAGEPVTLSWSTTNATSVAIDHGLGSRPLSGSAVVTPPDTTTYTLTATGAAGSTMRQATVTIVPPPTIVFSVEPGAILPGGVATLRWMVQDATTIFGDHDLGLLSPFGSVVVHPAATTTYLLTATGIGGTRTAQATVSVGGGKRRAVRH
jgi:hypothetical protein